MALRPLLLQLLLHLLLVLLLLRQLLQCYGVRCLRCCRIVFLAENPLLPPPLRLLLSLLLQTLRLPLLQMLLCTLFSGRSSPFHSTPLPPAELSPLLPQLLLHLLLLLRLLLLRPPLRRLLLRFLPVGRTTPFLSRPRWLLLRLLLVLLLLVRLLLQLLACCARTYLHLPREKCRLVPRNLLKGSVR